MLTKRTLLAEDVSQGGHPWKTHADPLPVSPSLYQIKIQNNKVDSNFLMTSHVPATVLMPRGLIFKITLLHPTDFTSNPQSSCYNCVPTVIPDHKNISDPFKLISTLTFQLYHRRQGSFMLFIILLMTSFTCFTVMNQGKTLSPIRCWRYKNMHSQFFQWVNHWVIGVIVHM